MRYTLKHILKKNDKEKVKVPEIFVIYVAQVVFRDLIKFSKAGFSHADVKPRAVLMVYMSYTSYMNSVKYKTELYELYGNFERKICYFEIKGYKIKKKTLNIAYNFHVARCIYKGV